MQIPMGDNRRVDFYGNAKDGVYVELVDDNGITFVSREIDEDERLLLIETLTRVDNGRSV
ncbi:hypothetical protein [Paenibacillus donghaensis]|uniref:Uncharacterized protein n=1 Tax=Paenibacillus donghaensis TaxID=414771 RepID=A0A2Z2K7U4_9BACL|nr:hypothetical protein [Paenibacillus donghaensis]ASA22606.1 hypothetical protein B9T62_18540 [Paenibacillus donghaensis]